MPEKNISVAIDGPAAAGKSTVAKRVAKILGYTYIDTGAMYRAFTYAVIKRNLDPKNEALSCSIIPDVDIELLPGDVVMCNGEDVTSVIREPLVSGNVSYIASYKDIRLALVELQRKMAASKSV
ncbi:MAG: (d)CMP kinase, partial [Bacilli bacterium]|nr:(d)CMP kinase [Bacilli bacterium]